MGSGRVIHWPSSRSARAAKSSSVTRQALPNSDLTMRSQNFAGTESLDRHLRMVDGGTPISDAMTLGEGQQAITSRKDANIVSFIDQIGPLRKTKLERDKMSHLLDNGSRKGANMTKKDKNFSEEKVAFIRRTREARLARFKEMEPIAALLRITVAQYKHYERRSQMPAHLVVPFCYATGVDVEWLLQGTGKGPGATQVAHRQSRRTTPRRKGSAA